MFAQIKPRFQMRMSILSSLPLHVWPMFAPRRAKWVGMPNLMTESDPTIARCAMASVSIRAIQSKSEDMFLRDFGLNRVAQFVFGNNLGARSKSVSYQTPGIIEKLFFLYFPPSSFRYLLSFFLAHTAICATATAMKTAVLHDRLTVKMASQAILSNK